MDNTHIRPIFIGGCDRSGTTLLGALLGRAQGCTVTPESQFKAYLLWGQEDWGERPKLQDIADITRHLAADFRYRLWDLPPDRVEQLEHGSASEFLLGLVSLHHQIHGDGTPLRYWIDHTPDNLQWALRLTDAFPDARFIHLLRDPRAVIASLLRTDWGVVTPARAVDFWWRRMAAGYLVAPNLPAGRLHTIRYESLLEMPGRTLAEARAFCGIAAPGEGEATAEVRLPAYTRSQHALVGRTPDVNRARSWRNELSEREIAYIEYRLGDCLRALGYPLATEQRRYSDADLRLSAPRFALAYGWQRTQNWLRRWRRR